MNTGSAQTHSLDIRRTSLYGLAVFSGLCAALGLCFLFKTSSSSAFLQVTNLPRDTTADISLESSSGIDALALTDGTVTLPEKLQASLKLPYRLSTALRLNDDTYRDFIFAVNKDGLALNITADGFHPQDTVTLSLDGRNVYDHVPLDWSGRLELSADLPVEKSVTACIDVVSETQSLGICHVVAKGRSS